VIFVSILGIPCVAQKHNVNCKEEYQFSKLKLDASVDILKKISGDVKVDSTTLGKVNEWTTVVLAQEGTLCNAYKQSTEAQFPTTKYLEELDKLRNWDESFLEMVLKYVSSCSEGKKGPADLVPIKTDAEQLLNHLPKLEAPPTAAKAEK